MATPFTFEASHEGRHGPEFDYASDSEFEHLNGAGDTEAMGSVYLWYGRQLLIQYLAKGIADVASEATQSSDLDWSLTRALASFPYSNILARLRETGLYHRRNSEALSPDTAFAECVTALGSTAMSKSDQAGWVSNFLAGNIAGSSPRRLSTERMSSGDAPPHVARPAVSHSVPSDDDPNLPRYTMKLKEIGDAEGREPQYSFTQLSLVPPIFNVVVRFGTSAYEGEASTKKKAKHLASKSACGGLGVSL